MVAGASPQSKSPQPAGQQVPVGHGQQGPGLMVIAQCPQRAQGLGFPPGWATAVLGRGGGCRGLSAASCCGHSCSWLRSQAGVTGLGREILSLYYTWLLYFLDHLLEAELSLAHTGVF